MGCLLTCELFHGYLYNLVFGDRTRYCVPNHHFPFKQVSLVNIFTLNRLTTLYISYPNLGVVF